jgi:PAS domain S-box-containing protein
MNISRIKNYFQSLNEIDSLNQLRQRILGRVLIATMAIGIAAFFFSVIPIFTMHLYLVLGVFAFVFICLVVITFVERISYYFRVGVYVFILFLSGVINLILNGFNIDSGVFFLAFIALTFFFAGLKNGLTALAVTAVAISASGFLITTGRWMPLLDHSQQNPVQWVISSVVFFLVSLLLILAFTTVANVFEQNLLKAGSLSREIEKAFNLQHASEERFRALIEGSLDVIGILGTDGIVKYASPSVEMVLGYNPEELVGQNVFASIHPDDVALARDALGPDLPADQVGPKLDLRLRHKDGTWRDLEVRGREMHATPGILGTIVSCRDITERKRALAELKESSLFLKRMFSGMADGVIVSETVTDKILDCNESALEMFGYTRDELLSRSVADLHVDSFSFQKFENKLEHAADEHKLLTRLEYRLKRKGGTLFPVEISVTPVNDAQGKITGWASVIRDISDRKVAERLQAEEREALKQDVFDKTTELHKANERLKELVDLSSAVIYSSGLDKAPALNFITENVQRMLGFSPAEIIADPEFWKKHVHPDDIRRLSDLMTSVSSQNNGVVEYRFLNKDGNYRWIHDEVRLVRDSQGALIDVVGSWFDITDRKQAEEALRTSEAKYRTLYTGIMDAFVSTDMDGWIVESNEIYQKMLGYTADELQKLTYIDLTPEKWHPIEAEVVRKQILIRGYSDVYEKEYIRKDGTIFPVELRTVILRDDSGNPIGMWALVRDISERKKIESNLQASEERYRTLAETAHDMIYIIDPDDRILYVNTFATAYFGLQPKDVIGHLRADYFKSKSDEQQTRHIEKVIHSGQPAYDEFITHFPGKDIWLSTWIVPLKDPDGKISAVLGVSRDITERKNAEETLQRFNEKLEEQVSKRTVELRESHSQLRKLANQVIKLQEDERKRISRELHDEAGQDLILLKYNLNALLVEIPDEQDAVRKKLLDSVGIIDQTMGLIRNLSHSLRPPVMDVGGLNLSLRELCWDFTQRTGLKINYIGEDIPNLPDEIGISLYRIAQEALVNIVKHSRASRADIHLDCRDKDIALSIRDNGKGMDHPKTLDGIGLMGIEERINLLGGTLDMESMPGKGLRLLARVPWKAVSLDS